MRTYRLPQGPFVSLNANRRLLDTVARYLDAHADAVAEPADGWSVSTTRHAPAATGPARPWTSFGERFAVTPVGAGADLIQHEGTPSQIWRLDERRVQIVVEPSTGRYAVAQSLYAAVRRIGLLAVRQNRGTVLHAAAVDAGDGAILLCGEKGSGKTTLTLALLQQGAAFLASDRTIAWQAGDETRATGWPAAFRFAPAVAELALDSSLAAAVRRHIDRHRGAPAYWFAGKFRFAPRDLLSLIHASARSVAKPRLLVELDGASGGGAPAWMSRAETEAAWRRHRVAGEAFPTPPGEAQLPLEAPRALRGVRLGRSTPSTMARTVLALAAS